MESPCATNKSICEIFKERFIKLHSEEIGVQLFSPHLVLIVCLNVHTSGTPIHGCRAGTLDGSSASGKCSESGTRAVGQ